MKAIHNVTKHDQKIISQVMDQLGTYNTDIILTVLRKRLKILSTEHILYVGYLIGASQTARSLYDDILNNLQPCQRQN